MWGRVRPLVLTELGAAKLGYYLVFHSCTQVLQENGGTCGSGKVVTREPKSSVNMEEPSECHSVSKRTRVRKQVGKKLKR